MTGMGKPSATFRADDFKDDAYGWLTNQGAHASLVGVVLAAPGLAWGFPPYLVPVIVALVYGVAWEWLWQRGGMVADSLMDTACVMAGASILAAAWVQSGWTLAAVLVVWGAVLIAGYWRRL
jgi:ABC-type Mn2+/Zn2+ transport system permease subunit